MERSSRSCSTRSSRRSTSRPDWCSSSGTASTTSRSPTATRRCRSHPASPFDYFHVNSIQPESNGDLVISARNTSAAYAIDPHTGAIAWTLGGKHSSFKLGAGVAVRLPARRAAAHQGPSQRHLVRRRRRPAEGARPVARDPVRIDGQEKTATLVAQDLHAPALTASFEGNVQELRDGDEFVGWGQQPYFSEFDSSGQMVFDGRFVGNNSSYRAYRYPWIGTPRTPPDGHAPWPAAPPRTCTPAGTAPPR